jgi:hypothetical protein
VLKLISHIAVFGCAALAASCSVGIDGDACNFVEAAAAAPRCQEREVKEGPPTAAFKTQCENAGGNYGGGCPDGQVAGCQIMDGATERIVDWYYPPMTREDVTSACSNMGTVVDN